MTRQEKGFKNLADKFISFLKICVYLQRYRVWLTWLRSRIKRYSRNLNSFRETIEDEESTLRAHNDSPVIGCVQRKKQLNRHFALIGLYL